MKQTTLLIFFAALCLYSCGSPKEEKKITKIFPVPGTVVAIDSVPIVEDKLNNSRFIISVVADSAVTSGVYDVDADFGPNFAEGQFTLPTGKEDLLPVMRRGKTPYTFIIGFRLPGDTTFYDYFEVSSNTKQTKMKYLKAYTF